MEKKISSYFYCLLFLLSNTILNAQNGKCGTFRHIEQYWNYKLFKADQTLEVRPELQKSILTPNNKIRIHFDTSGINQPAMVDLGGNRIPNSYQQYIDSMRVILEKVWKIEIDEFNFNTPPADNGRGGGDEYDFYVLNFSSDDDFGETVIEFDLPVGPIKQNQQYASFIKIDNEFGGLHRTKGIPALKATCAHEFHHAIQVGGSGVWEGEHFYFYELCAEAMENTVFKDAKDYIFDVNSYFANISSIQLFQLWTNERRGYERAIWGMFLMKKYGAGIMREIWEEIKTHRPVQACNNAFNTFSTSIQREFVDFTYWNFYTGYRGETSKYYMDAGLMPVVSILQTINVVPQKQNIQFTTKSFTANYLKAVTNTDSAFIIISNTNYTDALNSSQRTFPFQLSFSSSSSSDIPAISNSIFARFQVDEYSDWSYNAIGTSRGPICFPNPFNPNSSSLLISLQGMQNDGHASLNIFSAGSIDLIYSGPPGFKFFSGTQYAEWSGRDNHGNLAASGVYMFVLSNGAIINKGKFAVIR